MAHGRIKVVCVQVTLGCLLWGLILTFWPQQIHNVVLKWIGVRIAEDLVVSISMIYFIGCWTAACGIVAGFLFVLLSLYDSKRRQSQANAPPVDDAIHRV